MPCESLVDGEVCGASPSRPYLTGDRCAAHTPAALAGRPECSPDPALTLDALRLAAGIAVDSAPPASASALTDNRAIASGKRRASLDSFRQARAAVSR
jgi:hypothetical protein